MHILYLKKKKICFFRTSKKKIILVLQSVIVLFLLKIELQQARSNLMPVAEIE